MSKGSPSLKTEPAPTITRPTYRGETIMHDDVPYTAVGWDTTVSPVPAFLYRRAPAGTAPPAGPADTDSLKPFFVDAETRERRPDLVAAWRLEVAGSRDEIQAAISGIKAVQREDGQWINESWEEVDPARQGYVTARAHLMGLGGSRAAGDLEVCVRLLGDIRAAFDTTSLERLLRRIDDVQHHRELALLDAELAHGDAAKSAGDRVAALRRQIADLRERLWPALRSKLDRPLAPGVIVTALPDPTAARSGRYPPPAAMTGRVELTFNPLES